MNVMLISLTLDNFKCHRHVELDFEGRSADLFGDNATGKSSVYDALTWLLFGKDSHGRKDFDVKPLDELGQVRDHGAVTAVEAVLSVDGMERRLKRTYYELWVTKRGGTDASFDGHSSDYFVDGVPCKKSEFEERVGEIVREDAFRMLTSLTYFPSEMPWKDRRAVLFSVAGTVSDQEIMRSDSRFDALAQAMGDRCLDDYRKILATQRKQLSGIRLDIPARLDECQKTVEDLAELDFDKLEQQRDEAQALYDEAKSVLEQARQDGGRQELSQALRQADVELRELENRNTAFRLEQKAALGPDELAPARRKLAEATCAADRARRELDRLQKAKQHAEALIAQCRAEWDAVNREQFQGGVCPTCRQTLPPDQLAAAKAAFVQSKDRRKKAAVAKADDVKAALADTVQDIEERQAWLSECEESMESWQARVDELTARPRAEIPDMPGYEAQRSALTARRDGLQEELRRLRADQVSQLKPLERDVDDASAQLRRLNGELAKKALLERTQERMDELRQQAQDAADRLARVDRMIDLCEAFLRYKAGFVEDSVNSRFQLVRFRLFREQINGGLEDCCEATVGGVAYNTNLNEGAKVNAGVDIINTLSRYYDAHVPLFMDNAERVTRLLPVDTQIIRLIVSEDDKELRCELK